MASIINFDASALNRLGEEGAMRRLIAAGFRMSRDVKLSFGSSGIPGATKAERHANRSKPGEPPHVDTGRLKGSISVNWELSGLSNGEVEPPARTDDGVDEPPRFTVRVGSNVEYAEAMEFGTSRMAPRPYLRPAIDRLKL